MKKPNLSCIMLYLVVVVLGAVISSLPILASDKQVVINHLWWGGNPSNVIQQAQQEFETNHPNIKISLTPNASLEKILLHSVAGTVDTMIIDSHWFPELYSKGILAPLDKLIARSEEARESLNEDFWPGSYNWSIREGKHYGYPFTWMQSLVLFYNKDMFSKTGIPYPTEDWTWDDLIIPIKKMTNPEENRYGITWEKTFKGIAKMAPMNGGGVVDNHAHPKAATLTNPRTLETVEFWISLEREYGLGGWLPNVAMVISWWGIKNLFRDLDYDIVPPPVGPSAGDDARYPTSTCVYAISSISKHQEEAFEWITFLSLPRIMKIATTRGAGVPTRRSITLSDEWLHADDKNNAAVFPPLEGAIPCYPMTPAWREICDLMAEPVAKGYRGEVDLIAVFREMNDRVDALIRKYDY